MHGLTRGGVNPCGEQGKIQAVSDGKEAIDEIHHELGLDQPLLVRYGKYMWDLFTKGEMGKSWVMQTSVKKNFIERLPNTLILTALALLLTSVVGIVAGVFAAVNQNSAGDRITMILAMLLISLPNFFLSLICQVFICLKLKWLPVAGAGSFRHFILPAIMLAATGMSLPQLGERELNFSVFVW